MNLSDLRTIRKANKVTIKQVAKNTGVNRDRISLIERNKVNPQYATVESIAAAIGAKITLMNNHA